MSEQAFPIRTLLFVSLAVNLLAIGGMAGAFLSGARLQQPAPEPEPTALVQRLPGPRAFLAALPQETRVKMRQELAASWRESREARQAAARARRDAFAAIGELPYDAERVKAAFAQMRAADQAALGVFHDNIVDAFGNLSEEERNTAIEALRAAAPARRASVLPEGDAAPAAAGSVAPGDGALREKMRERWRERRQQHLQEQQQAPAAP